VTAALAEQEAHDQDPEQSAHGGQEWSEAARAQGLEGFEEGVHRGAQPDPRGSTQQTDQDRQREQLLPVLLGLTEHAPQTAQPAELFGGGARGRPKLVGQADPRSISPEAASIRFPFGCSAGARSVPRPWGAT
jgi:hypothetical protein